MRKWILIAFLIIVLIAYFAEAKKQTENKEGNKKGYKDKRESKFKQNKEQKEGSKKDKKGKQEETKQDEKLESGKQEAETKEGKKEKTKKEEKVGKENKDTQKEKKQKKQEKKPKEEEKSCAKDGVSCEEKPAEPAATETACTIHADCLAGYCCKPSGVCQRVNAREGQKCWNSCMCSDGLFCYLENQSQEIIGICKTPIPEDLVNGSYLQ